MYEYETNLTKVDQLKLEEAKRTIDILVINFRKHNNFSEEELSILQDHFNDALNFSTFWG
jgi:hypothetical protein